MTDNKDLRMELF